MYIAVWGYESMRVWIRWVVIVLLLVYINKGVIIK